MKLKIDWKHPIIGEGEVMRIQPGDMDDFYVSASDLDKSNLFFILLASLHHYEERNDTQKAAHLSFLAANYLFIALTPPGSYDLALHYMKKAIALDPKPEYDEWLVLMEKGN